MGFLLKIKWFYVWGCCLCFLLITRVAEGGQTTNFVVRDLNGKQITLKDYKNKLVLMSFWATWCKPCIMELQHLEKLYAKYKQRGFVVLAVSMDTPESQANVKPLVQRYRLSYPVVIDKESRLVNLYNPTHAAPFTVFINDGRVHKTREGFQLGDLPLIERDIQEVLH